MRGCTMSTNDADAMPCKGNTQKNIEERILEQYAYFSKDSTYENKDKISNLWIEYKKIKIQENKIISKPNDPIIKTTGKMNMNTVRKRVEVLKTEYVEQPVWSTRFELSMAFVCYEICHERLMENIKKIKTIDAKKHKQFEKEYVKLVFNIQNLTKSYLKDPTLDLKLELSLANMDLEKLSYYMRLPNKIVNKNTKKHTPYFALSNDLRCKQRLYGLRSNLNMNIKYLKSQYKKSYDVTIKKELELAENCYRILGLQLTQPFKRAEYGVDRLRIRLRCIIYELEKEYNKKSTLESLFELNRAKKCFMDLLKGKNVANVVFSFKTPKLYTQRRNIQWKIEQIRSLIKEYKKSHEINPTEINFHKLQYVEKELKDLLEKRKKLHRKFITKMPEHDKIILKKLYSHRNCKNIQLRNYEIKYSKVPSMKLEQKIERIKKEKMVMNKKINDIRKKYAFSIALRGKIY